MTIQDQPAPEPAERAPGIPPLLPLKEYPRLVALCAAAGLALGLGVAALTPATYTAEARLAVGSGEMSNLNIPGYPTASADMAENYSRWVTITGAGGKVIADDGSVKLSASPLPASNVIRLEAKSSDSELALSTADEAADALQTAVNEVRDENDPEKILAEIEENAPVLAATKEERNVIAASYRNAYAQTVDGTLTEADIQVWLDRLTEVESEYQRLEAEQTARTARYQRLVAQRSTEADLTVVQSAEITNNDRVSMLQRLGLVGLAGGAFIGFIAAHVRYRRGLGAAKPTSSEQAETASPARTRRRRTNRDADAGPESTR